MILPTGKKPLVRQEGQEEFSWFLEMFVLTAGVHSAVASWRLPESNHILRYVDAQIILLAFYFYTEFRSGHQGSAEYTVLPLAVMFLDLLTVNRLRTGGEQENVEAVAELAEEAIPLWVFELLGILLLLGIAGWLLYRYRGKTLKRIKRISRRRKVVRKSRLFAALKEVLRNLRERLVFEVNYRRYRKTPQGLLDRIWYAGQDCALEPEEYKRYVKVIQNIGDR